ncbi:hypothetical protein ACFYXS_39285 [Streptomyces sp. NPDC002574]|uniref:hypothetical protein n=1 Tax=Streptomyces sp. NPDC002574 TaxID=3364652 RepID=UPI00367D9954
MDILGTLKAQPSRVGEGLSTKIISRSVEDECGAGYVADPAGAERDVLERAPAFFELDGSTLAEWRAIPDQGVHRAGVSLEGLFTEPSSPCRQA